MLPYEALIHAIKFKKSAIQVKPRGWTKKRITAIRERDNYICQLCGDNQGSRALHVHHIDANRYNCNLDNVITLCPKCHSSQTYQREYINEFIEKVKE